MFTVTLNDKKLKINESKLSWNDECETVFDSIAEITKMMDENPDFFAGAEVQRAEKPKTGKERQAAYAEKQRSEGRKQRSMWLTDDEALAVAALLKQMRN